MRTSRHARSGGPPVPRWAPLLLVAALALQIATAGPVRAGTAEPAGAALSLPTVINGKPADQTRTKWFVSWYPGDGGHCGGMIIAKRWILTAAHCVVGAEGNDHVFVKVNPKRRDFSPTGYRVDRMISHPGFLPGFNLPHDVGLLHVTRNLPSARIALNQVRTAPVKGAAATVYGFGATGPTDYEGSPTMRSAVLRDLSGPRGRTCGRYPRNRYDRTMQLCAAYPQLRRDACWGDSGGPLVAKVRGREVLVGIVSNGGDECTGNPQRPGIYTRVSTYTKWIRRAMVGPNLDVTSRACPSPGRLCRIDQGQRVRIVITNQGGGVGRWRASPKRQPGLRISATGGKLARGGSTTVTVTSTSPGKRCQSLVFSGSGMLDKKYEFHLNGSTQEC